MCRYFLLLHYGRLELKASLCSHFVLWKREMYLKRDSTFTVYNWQQSTALGRWPPNTGKLLDVHHCALGISQFPENPIHKSSHKPHDFEKIPLPSQLRCSSHTLICALHPLSSFRNRHSLKKIFPLCFADVLLGFHKICLIFLLKSIFFLFYF